VRERESEEHTLSGMAGARSSSVASTPSPACPERARERERERERERGGGRERARERAKGGGGEREREKETEGEMRTWSGRDDGMARIRHGRDADAIGMWYVQTRPRHGPNDAKMTRRKINEKRS
jgi:hypothetical protein